MEARIVTGFSKNAMTNGQRVLKPTEKLPTTNMLGVAGLAISNALLGFKLWGWCLCHQ